MQECVKKGCLLRKVVKDGVVCNSFYDIDINAFTRRGKCVTEMSKYERKQVKYAYKGEE